MNLNIGTVKDIVTLVGVFVGPWIAVRISVGQYAIQRWWERRADTYARLLEALSILRWNASQEYNKMLHLSSFEHTEPPDKDPSLIVLAKLAAQGNYMISERAVKALTDFIRTFTDEPALSIGDTIVRQIDAADLCLNVIREEANTHVKSDLGFFRFPQRHGLAKTSKKEA
jgi:hypothetical protein